jgi:hypothetical protein
MANAVHALTNAVRPMQQLFKHTIAMRRHVTLVLVYSSKYFKTVSYSNVCMNHASFCGVYHY